MAKIKISALPETASLQASDLLTAVANSISSKVTVRSLANSLTQVTSSISSSYAANGGVTSIIAGSGISVDTSTGDVTITNTGGGGAAFPYTGSAKITGSLDIVGPLRVTGSINTSAGVRIVDGVFIKTSGGSYNNYFALDGNDNLSIPSYGTTPYGIKIVDSGGNLFANFLGSTTPQFVFTGSANINGDLNVVNGGVTSSLFGTSSWALNVVGGAGGGPISVIGSTLYSNDPATSEVNNNNSIFLGSGSGYQATNAYQAIFLGSGSGYQATDANNSNFIGQEAGNGATYANGSNFLGYRAGYLATDAYYAVYIGYNAGLNAALANSSIFMGYSAGDGATNSAYSVFIGEGAGQSANEAPFSVFLNSAGASAYSASYSFMAGYGAGTNTLYGSGSILIGLRTGQNYQAANNGIGANNTIIGNELTLPENYSNYINLGGIIFGSGSYSTEFKSFGYTKGPFSGSVNGKVGINQMNPQYSLDVSGSGRYTNNLIVTGSLTVSASSALGLIGSASIVSGALAVGNITPSATVGRIDASNDVVAFSTSDERLKTGVSNITDPITKVNMINGVNFTWVENPEVHGNSGRDVGVIAQEIEKVLPEVVTTRDNGYKAVKYEKIVPLLIEAIKDLQKQIDELKANK